MRDENWIKDKKEFLETLLKQHVISDCQIINIKRNIHSKGAPIYDVEVIASGQNVVYVLKLLRNQRECEGMRHARERIGFGVPKVYYVETSGNPLQTSFAVMDFVSGNLLDTIISCFLPHPVVDEQSFKEVFSAILQLLLRLHEPRHPTPEVSLSVLLRHQISTFRDFISKVQEKNNTDAIKFLQNWKLVNDYFETNETFFAISEKSLLHGDLFPTNIILPPQGDVVLLDWERWMWGDYCSDLVYFKERVLAYSQGHEDYFHQIVNAYRDTFNDETIMERLKLYIALYFFREVVIHYNDSQWWRQTVCEKLQDFMQKYFGD